ncbi:MAG: single-stranded-DNA-specific exonuclease RecJ [Ardenticatenaceae bacterium]|nr:single-stranded-DNA-specific exonuclease RecJ [Ardenticatenaceae bacterium]
MMPSIQPIERTQNGTAVSFDQLPGSWQVDFHMRPLRQKIPRFSFREVLPCRFTIRRFRATIRAMKRPDELRATTWQIAPPIPAEIRQNLSHIHPVLLQILYNRGVVEPGDIQSFLDGRYLHSTDPFLLQDMDKAVARIQQAIANDERIIVYGDFDADGVTATVLLTEALRGLGLDRDKVQPYIPDRVDEGYGLNIEALTALKEEKEAGLVISVDCGIRSVAEVEHANRIGLDMIITDHHSLGPVLPPAAAIVNPKRPSSEYPEKMLAGVGIAYKLAQALAQTMPDRVQFNESDLLDLVAVGTVADLAPLLGENRQLVINGLGVLNKAQRPGVASLIRVSNLRAGGLTAESIGFGLGPRINAAGRINHAYDAAKLLAANNTLVADQLAHKLNELNRKRQELTADLSAQAEAMVENPAAPILIVGADNFMSGVVGLVASRLAEKYYRPAIILEHGDEESRASCRSIPEFHITDALDEVADLLVRHGGHAQAAGFTILNENLPEFTERVTAIAAAKLDGLDLQPTVTIDMELDVESIDWALYETLAQLEPTGYANATPVFLSRGVEVTSHRAVGSDGNHLQLRLNSGTGGGYAYRELSAIAFRQGAWVNSLPQYIDIVYTIGVNEWNGRRSLQLMVQDIRSAGMTGD